YQKQSRALDAEERRKYVRDFERRLLDEEAHYAYTLQWHRIIPHSAKLRGWTVTPSHFVNNQLDSVWLTESRTPRRDQVHHQALAPDDPHAVRRLGDH